MKHVFLTTHFDWDNAPDVPHFYGRTPELFLLKQWMMREQSRMIGILGMGGMGKSALAVTLMHQVATAFEHVAFRSLRNAPPFRDLLVECLQTFSSQPLSKVPVSSDQCLDLLLTLFQTRRCLLVLDNFEALLQEEHYLAGYQDYGELLQRIGETPHQSCLVLTSRETPLELAHLERVQSSVYTLPLGGLEKDACEQLFEEQGLMGTLSEREELANLYEGNPLALRIVADTISDLFENHIGTFLQQGEVIFSSIRDLLAQQIERLAPLEHILLTWLAIMREPAGIADLLELLPFSLTQDRTAKALEVLQRHSLVEQGKQQRVYTLQSVVLQYVIEELVESICTLLQQQSGERFAFYALELAHVKEYVRQAQIRLFVKPILFRLRTAFRHTNMFEEILLHQLNQFRGKPSQAQGYGPANLIVLLRELRGHLRGLDLSQLVLRDAYLQGVEMQDTSLTGSTLHNAIFTQALNAPWSVAISNSGYYWGVGSRRGEVRVWREGGRQLHLLWQAHADNTCTLAFSPDERTLATGSWDGSVKVWDLENGTLLWTGWHADLVRSVVFSPDGKMLASGGNDASIQIWNARSGDALQTVAVSEGVYALAWSPDGRFLAGGGFDSSIRLWELKGEKPASGVRVLSGHTHWVTALAFAPDGVHLASGSWDTTVRLWDVESGCECWTLAEHAQRVRTIVWSPDGRMLASAGFDQSIWLWDREQGSSRAVLQGHTAMVHGLAFACDNRSLLSSSEDGTLRVWDVEQKQCTRIIESYAVSFHDLAWRPDGQMLASAGSDLLVTLWDVKSGIRTRVLRGHSWNVFGMAWSPDGQLLVSSGWDGSIRLWEPDAGTCLRILRDPDHDDTIFHGIAWSPGGSLLASGSYMHGVQVWDMVTTTRRWVGHSHQIRISRVAWSPDGTQLASCSNDGSVVLWNASDGMLLEELREHRGGIACVSWSPDSERLVSGGGGRDGGEIIMWDQVRKKVLWSLSGLSAGIGAVTWNATGEMVISGGSDGVLRWWKGESGTCIRSCEGHHGAIHALKISPDGQMLASSGDDSTIRLWDIASGKLVKTLRQDRPYERLDITGVRGLTEAQKATLRALGAIEQDKPEAISSKRL